MTILAPVYLKDLSQTGISSYTPIIQNRTITIINAGEVLTSSSLILHFTDSDAKAGITRYDVWKDGVDITNSVLAPENSIAVHNLPTDGSTFTLTLRPPAGYIDDEFTHVTANFTAVNLTNQGIAESYHYYGNPLPIRGLTNASVDPGGIATSNTKGENISFALEYKGTTINSVKWYMIYELTPGGYHKGDGGLIKAQIVTDNAGFPSNTVLGETPSIVAAPGLHASQAAASSTYPGAVWTHHGETGTALNVFRKIDLVSPITGLTPGTRIHVVFVNTTPNPALAHVGVNMVGSGDGNPSYRKNNYFDNDPAFASGFDWKACQKKNGVWSSLYGLMGVFELEGDLAQGQVRYAVSNTPDPTGRSDRTANIGGTRKIRQVITPVTSMTFEEIGLFLGRNSGTGPVTCTIKQGGTTLWSSDFTGFPLLGDISGGGGPATRIVEKSAWVTKAANFSCIANTQITMELSTPSGTDYEVPMSQDGAGGYFVGTTGLSSGFIEGHAQDSTDNGSTWTNMYNSGAYGTVLDCIFYFKKA